MYLEIFVKFNSNQKINVYCLICILENSRLFKTIIADSAMF